MSTSEPMRAAIYLRISQDRELDGLAIERQREDCERLLKQRGWEAAETYVDQSVSATDRTRIRPAYDRMVSDYAAGRFAALVCWDLDRLTRQPRQLEDWIERAEENGLHLVTANGEADLSTDGGRMYARIKAAVARAEVERKGARQSRAQRQRAERGRPGKGVRPLGYRLDGTVIQHEAEAVVAIYRSFASGGSLRAIAAALSGETRDDLDASVPPLPRFRRTLMLERNSARAEQGLPPRPVPEDGPWAPSTVLGILRNPRYIGVATYTPKEMQRDGNRRRSWRAAILRQDSGEPIRGDWEPIVSEATWWTVQERLDDPARVTNRVGTHRRHLGSGLFLCCMCGKRVRAHGQRYRCEGHIMRSREHVDFYVIETVRARLARPDLAMLLPSHDGPRAKDIAGEIEAQRGRIARAQADYDTELIEARDLMRVRTRAEAAIAVLEGERITLGARASTSPVLEAADPVVAFDNADLATRRAVIETLCEVRLGPAPRGRKTFDPATVRITPKVG